ncbi:MAG TPA: ABC transporter permease [Acidimicrobiia bacterium]|nr:ABC transporter permease [Acidimicrobiia bacterium]
MTFIKETWLVFSRALRLSIRNPVWVILGVFQPILYLTLFGPLLEPVANTPGFPGGDAWQFFVPGLLVLLGLFGAAFVGFGLIAEWRSGVIDRMRVTPASRGSLLLGRVLRDVVVVTTQGFILVVTALFMGLETTAVEVAIVLGIVALLGGSFSAVSYGVALKLKSEDAFAPLVNGVLLPVMLLSGILLPMTFAPGWLETLSEWNPLTRIVDGARAIFGGDIFSRASAIGLAVTAGLVLVGVYFGTRMFKNESA